MSQTLWEMAVCLFGIVVLAFMVFFHDRRIFLGKIITKPLLSLLFFGTAWFQTPTVPLYAQWVIPALGLCLIGDVCLIFTTDVMFFIGLIFFLLGHLAFMTAFFLSATLSTWAIAGLALVLVISSWIYFRLLPYLGKMKLPVAVYVLSISFMVTGAITLAGDFRYPIGGRLMVLAGAMAFFVSDIFVAREQFIGPKRINLLVGLPLYYVSQFLLAFSIGMLA